MLNSKLVCLALASFFVRKKLCYNVAQAHFVLKGITGNMNITYTIATGYDFTSKSKCETILTKKYIVGNIYEMYYNNIQDTIYTKTYANTISTIGFIFIMLSCTIMIFYFVELYHYKTYIDIDNQNTTLTHAINPVNINSKTINPKNKFIENYCTICLQEIKNKKIILECNHCYHSNCINEWFKINNNCQENNIFLTKKRCFLSIMSY